MRHHFAAAILVVTLALVAACSSVSTDTAPNEVPVSRSSWVAKGLPVHTRLSATKDSIVYGGVDEENLYVVALDPASGKERWRRQSGVSTGWSGSDRLIVTDDDTAYFVQWEPDWQTALVAVRTATGKERWRRELWTLKVNPDAWSCGDAVCMIAFVSSRTEIWRTEKVDGSDVASVSITADGASGYEVILGPKPDSAEAVFLVASRDQVYITQFSDFGKVKIWSKPATELFGTSPVSPDGGWCYLRVDGISAVCLGPTVDRSIKHKPGDMSRSGVVASFNDRGNLRWQSTDRHMCSAFGSATSVPLCDGESHWVDAERSERRPNVIEFHDAMTGALKWKLDLNGEIDEWNPGVKVLRIDDNRYLLDLSTGRVLLDLHGPGRAPNELTTGWCGSEYKGDTIRRFGQDVSFPRTRNPFPCRLGGEHVEPTLPIPEFAGVNVAGWGAWVEDGQVHAKRQ